jgi:peptidoglycan/xylan/chitin deacetylase (PgdA/CDA1 family)
MNLIRPPYGAGPRQVREAAPGKEVVMWNVDSNDWRHRNDDAKILENIFEGAASVRARGGIILFHDIHPQTVRVLDDVIGRLQRDGYSIQRTDEYLANQRSGMV